MSKLLITPVLVAIEWLAYSKPASARVLASVGVLLAGITLCTITDTQVASNPLGVLVAAGAVVVTALYQVRPGADCGLRQARHSCLLKVTCTARRGRTRGLGRVRPGTCVGKCAGCHLGAPS
jgi:threonine/homoserine efflux transporter RhtA